MTPYRFASELVESEVTLALAPADEDVNADVVVTIERRPELTVPAMIEILHRGDLDGSPWALGVLPDGGWGFVFGHGCVGTMSADRGAIALTTLPEAPDEWLAEAIVGWALVYRLAVGGRSTFHASTTTLDGRSAVAVAGPGHSGKSTMAAAVMAIGGQLLGDDILVTRLDRTSLIAESTANATKLRGAAQRLAGRLDASASATFDQRVSVRSVDSPDSATLERIFFLDRTHPPGVSALDPAETVTRLIANSKVGIWNWEQGRDDEFATACEIADRVEGFALGRRDDVDSVDGLLEIAGSLFAV